MRQACGPSPVDRLCRLYISAPTGIDSPPGRIQCFISGEAAVRLSRVTGTLRVGTFHPLTSTTGAPAPDVAKCAVKVADSPGHSVTSLSLHRIGTIGSPPVDRLIATCWN